MRTLAWRKVLIKGTGAQVLSTPKPKIVHLCKGGPRGSGLHFCSGVYMVIRGQALVEWSCSKVDCVSFGWKEASHFEWESMDTQILVLRLCRSVRVIVCHKDCTMAIGTSINLWSYPKWTSKGSQEQTMLGWGTKWPCSVGNADPKMGSKSSLKS